MAASKLAESINVRGNVRGNNTHLFPPKYLTLRLSSSKSLLDISKLAPSLWVLNVISVDVVLIRSYETLPKAYKTLTFLQNRRIPFSLVTNGGGKSEEERVADLSKKLNVPLDAGMFVQSHTPFADLDEYKSKTLLVVV